MIDEYQELYTDEHYKKSDGNCEWNNGVLKFGDNFAAILYAHDINYQSIYKDFSKVGFPSGKFGFINYTVENQINYILKHKKRSPKNVLEIAGGRGEISTTLDYMGYKVTSVEFQKNAKKWFDNTSQKFFNKPNKVNLINENIKNVDLDLSKFDTIIISESLEHIPEKHFRKFYNNLKNNFKGYFIITNWLYMWPLPAINKYHCREINNETFDKFKKDSKKTIYRFNSHICLQY
tara:strand:+ start:114 stop:815 length:702 start_codon:yes stop_codon:yes gene_type:complete